MTRALGRTDLERIERSKAGGREAKRDVLGDETPDRRPNAGGGPGLVSPKEPTTMPQSSMQAAEGG